MPRVLPLSATEHKKLDFTKWIRGKCAAEKIKHEQIGKAWNVTHQAASLRISKANINYADLVILFRELHATDEEILKLMKWEGGK